MKLVTFHALIAAFGALLFAIPFSPVRAAQTRSEAKADIDCWQYLSNDVIDQPFTINGARLYVGRNSGIVESIDVITGKKAWSAELGGQLVSGILSTEDQVYAVTGAPPLVGESRTVNTLRALSTDTGVTLWAARLPSAGKMYLGQWQNVILVVSDQGTSMGISKGRGEVIWMSETASPLSAPPDFSGDRIALGSSDKAIHVISSLDGRVNYREQLEGVPSAVKMNGDRIAIGDERGMLMLIRVPDGKSAWDFKTGGKISSLSFREDSILVSSLDNFVYLISGDSGDIRWKSRQSGRIVDSSAVFEGLAIITTVGEQTAKLLNVQNGRLVYEVSLGENQILQPPIVLNGSVILTTTGGIMSRRISGCS